MSPIRTHVAAVALALLAGAAWAGDGPNALSLGIEGNDRAAAADVGLPVYAGAVPFTEGRDDKAAATVSAWAGRFGFKVQALKFRSDASVERVAAFYADALKRYGEVLDCREPAARVKPPKGSDKLSCEGSAPKPGDHEYRVGTARNFRVVSVRRHGEGSRFDMARVDLRF